MGWIKNTIAPAVITLVFAAYGTCTLVKVSNLEDKLHDMRVDMTYRFTRIETLMKIGGGNAAIYRLDASDIPDSARQRSINYYIGLAKSEVVEEKTPN